MQLNWADPDAAERSLRAAAEALATMPAEVIVVENGSRRYVNREALDGIPLRRVVFHTNVGVARGRNAGLAVSCGRYVLTLDDDALVLGGLDAVVEFMDREPSVGLAGPRIVDSSGATLFTCRKFPTLADKVSRRLPPGLGRFFLQGSELRDWTHAEPAFVDYVIGACHLIRREALEEVGPYDARMFYGPEDVDLCLRMWEAGWQVAYFPGAIVEHDERRITRGFSLLTLRHALALARYFAKHHYVFRRRDLYRRLSARSQAGGATAGASPKADLTGVRVSPGSEKRR